MTSSLWVLNLSALPSIIEFTATIGRICGTLTIHTFLVLVCDVRSWKGLYKYFTICDVKCIAENIFLGNRKWCVFRTYSTDGYGGFPIFTCGSSKVYYFLGRYALINMPSWADKKPITSGCVNSTSLLASKSPFKNISTWYIPSLYIFWFWDSS